MYKLGGYLKRIEIPNRNQVFRFNKHNIIVKNCIDNLLTLDGTNNIATANYIGNWLSLFIKSSQTSDREGIFNRCALGSGTGLTSVNDTALKNIKTQLSDTKMAGNNYCGFSITENTIKYRISHQITIDNDFICNEIGWFASNNANNLSSRVLLDHGINLITGDTVFVTYEFNVSLQLEEYINDLFGLGECYSVNALIYNSSEGCCGLPLINNNGIPYGGCTHSGNSGNRTNAVITPLYMFDSLFGPKTNSNNGPSFGKTFNWCSTNVNPNGKFNLARDAYWYDSNYKRFNISNIVLDDYIKGSCKRQIHFNAFANDANAQIYSIIANGTAYKFGHYENENFVFTPINRNLNLRVTLEQSWATDQFGPTV